MMLESLLPTMRLTRCATSDRRRLFKLSLKPLNLVVTPGFPALPAEYASALNPPLRRGLKMRLSRLPYLHDTYAEPLNASQPGSDGGAGGGKGGGGLGAGNTLASEVTVTCSTTPGGRSWQVIVATSSLPASKSAAITFT